MSSTIDQSSEPVFASGAYKFRIVSDWAKYPPGYIDHDVAAVAVDKRDQVYLFTRGSHPVMIFDRDGNFLRSWGEGTFMRPHGMSMGPDEALYCTDDGGAFVRKYTLDGKMLLEIGVPGKPAPFMSGEPFNRCTHTALSPRGDIYVSDGYGNARVHKYSPDGKLLLSWGGPGREPGEFNIVHNICTDDEGWVYVADRENHRVQVFDGNGKFETQWQNLYRPCGMFMERGKDPLTYIGELTLLPPKPGFANFGASVKILKDGKLLARFGDPFPGPGPTGFVGPHGLCVDSHGDIYVGEVLYTQWPKAFPKNPEVPYGRQSIRKLVRIP